MPTFYSASQEYLDTSQFERLGHPGKFTATILTADAGQTDFTGSNYGYGAVMISGSYNGTITLSNGGAIEKASDAFVEGQIYELSVAKISGGSAATGGVYAFKRQQ
jgi:hypothetical protein